MNTKKIIMFVALFVTLSFGAVTASNASFVSDSSLGILSEIGKRINQSNAASEKTAFTVNNRGFTLKSFETFEIFLHAKDGKKPTEDEVIDFIVEKTVLSQEAEKRGLKPTKEETIKLMKGIKEQVDLYASENEKDRELLQALGADKDEYWKNEDVIEIYQDVFAIANLRLELQKEFEHTKGNGMLQIQDIDDFNNHFENFTNSLKEKAEVERK
jgi:hypothetical protein